MWYGSNDLETIPWPVGHYRHATHMTSTAASQCAADILGLAPFVVTQRRSVDRIAVWLTVAQTGGSVRLGLYNTDPATGLPSTLFADAGAVSLAGSGGLNFAVVSWDLPKGVYWTASINKGGGTLPTLNRYSGVIMGHINDATAVDMSTGNGGRYYSASQAFGALPSNAPALTVSAGADAPVVLLRRA